MDRGKMCFIHNFNRSTTTWGCLSLLSHNKTEVTARNRSAFNCPIVSERFVLTNSRERSPSWEAVSQQVTNPKDHCRVYKSQPVVSIVSEINTVRSLPPETSMIHLSVGIPSVSFLDRLWPKLCTHFLSPHKCYVSCLSHSPSFDHHVEVLNFKSFEKCLSHVEKLLHANTAGRPRKLHRIQSPWKLQILRVTNLYEQWTELSNRTLTNLIWSDFSLVSINYLNQVKWGVSDFENSTRQRL
jgi:hypothetical protein